MLGLLRLVVVLLVVLTVVYWCMVFWFRAGERDRLEAEWETEKPPLPRHTFVDIGMAEYKRSLRRKLLWGVYVVPITLICLLVYLVNYA
ncbi:hypothetical protein [Jannaschia pohangensis]|uniref:Cation/multidrug efflux pump n=1 Tax=Jannaschia pohangensis TaxID=390807 RepID=A0A1I3MLL6_9RHOB|nr:hypothetical protein [Jannaschia pohangensis]SFI97690.1 hypothetical protein SAMN04488095_1885 [Jannaschia pohangensis]